MLVLSRRINERIVIPCIDATVQVVGIQGSLVRLGVEAPMSVKVHREEVFRKSEAAPVGPGPAFNLRSRLNNVALGLAVLRHQTQGVVGAETQATLDQVDREVSALVASLREHFPQSAAKGPAHAASRPLAAPVEG